MNNKLESILDEFLGDEENALKATKKTNIRKEQVMQNFSLIERVDKVYVTEDGRQLLRERY